MEEMWALTFSVTQLFISNTFNSPFLSFLEQFIFPMAVFSLRYGHLSFWSLGLPSWYSWPPFWVRHASLLLFYILYSLTLRYKICPSLSPLVVLRWPLVFYYPQWVCEQPLQNLIHLWGAAHFFEILESCIFLLYRSLVEKEIRVLYFLPSTAVRPVACKGSIMVVDLLALPQGIKCVEG